MSSICFLSTAYWAPIQYYAKLIAFNKAIIEQWETYPKQTYRNRMLIYGANSIQSLQVPVIKGSFKNILLKDVKISYADNWQKNHIKSIESAYRSAPFYEYYIDDIIPFYHKKYTYLFDLNNELLEETKGMLDADFDVELSSDFELMPQINDYRYSMHPKREKNIPDNSFKSVEYIQGFEQRHGFVPNLSILDLIFNVGPEASLILKRCNA
ncbi:MAG: WbqC family protein [Salinivirgaceae bacterium]|jgi:hypothetical protein|nr:WbqC family protein [Salinivirgaceae bacterium]